MSDSKINLSSKEIINGYLNQSSKINDSDKSLIIEKCNNEDILIYSFIDLEENFEQNDKQFNITCAWFGMTENNIFIYNSENKNISIIERSKAKELKQNSYLSISTLEILDKDNKLLAPVLYFTNRQHKAVSSIVYLFENNENIPNKDFSSDKFYQDNLLEPIYSAKASFSKSNTSVFVRLLSYLKPYKIRVFWGVLSAFIIAGLNLVPPLLIRNLIDNVVTPYQKQEITYQVAWEHSLKLFIFVIVAIALNVSFLWVRLRTMAFLGEYVARDLRKQTFEHIQRMNIDFFSRQKTGSLISRLTSDTDRLWEFVAFGFVEATLSIITLIVISAVLISLDIGLGIIMVLPLPFILFGIVYHGKVMQKLFTVSFRKWSALSGVLGDFIPGIRIVKSFNQEKNESKRFNKSNDEMFESFNLIHKNWTTFWPFLMLSIHLITILVWIFALPRLLNNPENTTTTLNLFGYLSVGTFVSFLLYMGMFFHPIEVIGQMARMLNRSLSSASRVFELLDTNPELIEKSDGVKLKSIKGDINFKSVWFGYERIRPILKDINFEIKSGQMVGLVGYSGAGKSTIANLIARFYDVSSGKILVDGHDIKDLDIGNYRSQLGIVQQDPFLFHGSIIDNICYANNREKKEEINLMQAINAAKAANAHEFITKFPQAYDTIVGERGHTLSGGERQRISIARAIYNDPCLLILDEATSSVDTKTERKIQDAIDNLIKGRTTLIIAHRLSTLYKADNIFVIKDGKIIEEGNHKKLLALKNGFYNELIKMQQSVI